MPRYEIKKTDTDDAPSNKYYDGILWRDNCWRVNILTWTLYIPGSWPFSAAKVMERTLAALRAAWPHGRAGQVIGLLGGSFDPAHQGHVHITKSALVRFNLDQVWWLVSPGNPLKTKGPAPISQRVERARRLMQHPRVQVTDIEADLNTRYTAETLLALQRLYPGVHFVWLMGADNLTQFHLWQDWKGIMNTAPIGVLARPGDRIAARLSPAARVFRDCRIKGRNSHLLRHATAPAWSFVNLPMSEASSTAIRAKGDWT